MQLPILLYRQARIDEDQYVVDGLPHYALRTPQHALISV